MTRAVRHATVDDAWIIHEIARQSWHAAYDDLLGPETVDDVVDEWYAIGDLESSIREASGRRDAAFLVASGSPAADTETVARGFAHAVPWPEDRSVAFLARLYVRPDRWNDGTGTALLDALETELSAAFDRLRLAVLAANEVGISFYESTGFEHVETRPSDLGTDLEERVYEKSI
ncbi:GNAT family N-acetyltransferase [Natrinema longum]|uniref:GNAT family N-acetyltransferase n=1 Tax=Natrinema longum TaxID=370324 RepID=A0A8A2U730_9EURY|nr:GNAT family N-acetyltransferase [Natrinema longum]MBZ6494159.1 GNAT family N-acetyltransferase [Natrinema longum]QSW84511.1 GNAT family N-acetyltransferase [Natrinema longum]